MVGVVILLLWQQNKKVDARADALALKLDKQNEWQMALIDNNTRATMEAANAYRTLTETLKSLVDKSEDLDRDVRERMPK